MSQQINVLHNSVFFNVDVTRHYQLHCIRFNWCMCWNTQWLCNVCQLLITVSKACRYPFMLLVMCEYGVCFLKMFISNPDIDFIVKPF